MSQLTRDQIASEQRRKLRSLLDELIPANRFYATKLAGIDRESTDLLIDLPFTTKAEIIEDQRLNPPFGSNLTYLTRRYTRFSQTSGTTGEPIRWLDTTESWSWMVDSWATVFRESGVAPVDIIFFAFSFGPFLGFWTAFEAGQRIGALCIPGGGMSTSGRLRAILDNGATALCCTPTYAIRLGEAAVEEGIDLGKSNMRVIVAAGEPGSGIPAVRQRIEQLWPGARLKDHHGMTETGPVTFECAVRPMVLHVIESGYIPEVIDPESAEPVKPGEQGELVLTNLGRIGSPLIRYRTGDLVNLSDVSPCPCGRSDMGLEGGILGRTDDMLVVRGVNVFPSAVEAVIRRFEEVSEYRVTVTSARSMPELAVEVETTPGCPPDVVCRSVEVALRATFNLRIPVTAAQPGSLPRFEMKAKRWVRSD